MEFLEDTSTSTKQTLGFMEHVMKYDTHTKNYLVNTIQYTLLSILPVVLLNKFVQYMIPKADESKGNMEIGIEIISQLGIIYIGLFLIHRIVSYVPILYNNANFDDLNLISFTLPFLVIILSFQTKLGEKVDILYRRLVHYWTGVEPPRYQDEEHDDYNEHQEPKVHVRQPILKNNDRHIELPDYEERERTTQTQAPPPPRNDMNDNQTQQFQQGMGPTQQTQPNFDTMIEPMAANEMTGGFTSF